jgi:hypothetical protein
MMNIYNGSLKDQKKNERFSLITLQQQYSLSNTMTVMIITILRTEKCMLSEIEKGL